MAQNIQRQVAKLIFRLESSSDSFQQEVANQCKTLNPKYSFSIKYCHAPASFIAGCGEGKGGESFSCRMEVLQEALRKLFHRLASKFEKCLTAIDDGGQDVNCKVKIVASTIREEAAVTFAANRFNVGFDSLELHVGTHVY